MNFFKDCKTVTEVKQTYRDLVKIHHPDKGGSEATMKVINNEYEKAIKTAVKGGNLSEEEQEEEIINAQEYREALNAIHNLPGLKIEICGGWIWVSGNTYPHRAILKANKFFYASKKVMWYFRSPEFKTKNKKTMDIDHIRSKYGSHDVSSYKPPNSLK